MTGSGNEAVDQVTTEKMKPRVLSKYLQPRRNESADVLTHFGLHAKVNLLKTNTLKGNCFIQVFSLLDILSDGSIVKNRNPRKSHPCHK